MAHNKEFYIAETGSDLTGDGSEENPFYSLAGVSSWVSEQVKNWTYSVGPTHYASEELYRVARSMPVSKSVRAMHMLRSGLTRVDKTVGKDARGLHCVSLRKNIIKWDRVTAATLINWVGALYG